MIKLLKTEHGDNKLLLNREALNELIVSATTLRDNPELSEIDLAGEYVEPNLQGGFFKLQINDGKPLCDW